MKRYLLEMARTLAGAILYHSGAFHWLLARYAKRGAACVLCFHRILAPADRARCNSQDAIMLDDRAFEQVLDFLQKHFEVVAPREFLKRNSRQLHPSKPQCLVTFDDGWADNHTRAYPALTVKRVPAVIFLTTGTIGADSTFWVERLRAACGNPIVRRSLCERVASALNRPGVDISLDQAIEYLKHMSEEHREDVLRSFVSSESRGGDGDQMLTWEQVRQMGRDGIEFGSHTDTHPLLSYEDDKTVDRELRCSRQKIEHMAEQEVRMFAYPNGDWDGRVRERVKEVEYQCAFTTRPGWYKPGSDAYSIPRILLHDGNVTRGGRFSPAMFSLTLMGWR